jgi:hypothetical protein
MARGGHCQVTGQPVSDCGCGACDDDDGLVSLNPLPPVPYNGPIHDADGSGEDGEAA